MGEELTFEQAFDEAFVTAQSIPGTRDPAQFMFQAGILYGNAEGESLRQQIDSLAKELARVNDEYIRETAKRLEAEGHKEVVKLHVGTGVLTKDLVWCECGRGISLNGNWIFCPKCGRKIDQDSYAEAVQKARNNGAKEYLDADVANELAALRQQKEQAEHDRDRKQEFITKCQQLLGTHDSLEVAIERLIQQKEQAEAACAEMHMAMDSIMKTSHDNMELFKVSVLTRATLMSCAPNPGSPLLTELAALREFKKAGDELANAVLKCKRVWFKDRRHELPPTLVEWQCLTAMASAIVNPFNALSPATQEATDRK